TSLPEIAKVVPAVAGVEVQPAFELTLNGPADRLGVDLNIRSSAGQMTGALTTDLAAPAYAAAGTVSIEHLNLAPIVNDKNANSDITGNAVVDLRANDLSNPDSVAGTIKIDTTRVAAAGFAADRLTGTAIVRGRRVEVNARSVLYGSTASAAGHVVLPAGRGPVAIDVHGQTHRLDVKALPRSLNLPPVNTNINADFHLAGQIDAATKARPARPILTVDATLADSTVEHTRIAAGSTVRVEARQSEPAYEANAEVQQVDLQELGTAFGVKALADDRYRSRIDGHIELNGRGSALDALQANARGTITNASR